MRPPWRSGWLCGCLLASLRQPALYPHDSRHRLDREGLAAAPAEARPAHDEDGCPVEDPAGRAEQRPVAREELLPAADVDVGGEDHRIGPLLLVAPVDDVEEQVRAVPVEGAPPDLVYDEAGGPHEGGYASRRALRRRGLHEPVPELRRLEVVGPVSPPAAFAAVCLGKVGLFIMRSFI